jgi:hypothetical protein
MVDGLEYTATGMPMAASPSPNARSHPYRGLSVQHVDQFPDESFVRQYLEGREIYRRTAYLALVHDDAVALVSVAKASEDPLFSAVTDFELWAEPDATMWIEDPTVDVGNATAMAKVALAQGRSDISAYVVKGMFEHVNFIWEPTPIHIRVTEVTPPYPPKLATQAQQVVGFDEDLPPIEIDADIVTFTDLAAIMPSDSYLLPCRGSGAEVPGNVSYLDTRPADRDDWVMLGCERSMQFHRHFYGDEPPQVDFCPRKRIEADAPEGLWLVKCCLLERGMEYSDGLAVVPWGANLDEIRSALRLLTGVDQPAELLPTP